jgi:hypothetical protein
MRKKIMNPKANIAILSANHQLRGIRRDLLKTKKPAHPYGKTPGAAGPKISISPSERRFCVPLFSLLREAKAA